VAKVIDHLYHHYQPQNMVPSLHYRHFENDKILALERNQENYDSSMTISIAGKT